MSYVGKMQNFRMLKQVIHKFPLLVKGLTLKSVNWMFIHWVVNDIRWKGLRTDEQLGNCYELMTWELCPCDNLKAAHCNFTFSQCAVHKLLWTVAFSGMLLCCLFYKIGYFCINAICEPPCLIVIHVPPIITEVLSVFLSPSWWMPSCKSWWFPSSSQLAVTIPHPLLHNLVLAVSLNKI